jgi:hypothetical protein
MKTFAISSVFLFGLTSILLVPACDSETDAGPGAGGQGNEAGAGGAPDPASTCKVGKESFTKPGAPCGAAEEGKDCAIAGGNDPCIYGPLLTCRGGTWKAETEYLIDCSSVELDADGCPIDLEKAVGKACVAPKVDSCDLDSELDFKCVDGKWKYVSVGTCDPGTTADGDDCHDDEDGHQCGETTGNPCGFGHSLLCRAGKWHDQEAFPLDCGHGGQGGGGGQDNMGGDNMGGDNVGGDNVGGVGGAH